MRESPIARGLNLGSAKKYLLIFFLPTYKTARHKSKNTDKDSQSLEWETLLPANEKLAFDCCHSADFEKAKSYFSYLWMFQSEQFDVSFTISQVFFSGNHRFKLMPGLRLIVSTTWFLGVVLDFYLKLSVGLAGQKTFFWKRVSWGFLLQTSSSM